MVVNSCMINCIKIVALLLSRDSFLTLESGVADAEVKFIVVDFERYLLLLVSIFFDVACAYEFFQLLKAFIWDAARKFVAFFEFNNNWVWVLCEKLVDL